ncbi:Cys-tRNA(Pro) deacylase [Corynebacterium sp. 320]|uniref:Cys-tRNA(Pro) deacylase n=1 Tax=Corynebacterium TaxID=1716 RepID=UPI00125CC448|nr:MULTISPECIES: Cys-tRNA(Pro) deacylase [Corynebacterium]KAB1504444.1 Cys-tRNA(Pro) deacylase [Corynebacterium sp. 320]KAB1552457.1 Cys-tRNA(Pro) deacylase [Corynebacterium sp. 321]KAB1554328.1 Cys-tRNA(Pro) deacylase [Corynebacterium sp. 319]KAB3528580.1 Cys-tRNA(Pro) deacylase [Corynebacterium sp. 250]KAB3539928.1 Cys-tRNA(Pro) deacylase [Corynebacterium sp. 366]
MGKKHDKKSKTPHAATPALLILEEAGVPHTVSTFEAGTDHFGEHAAHELGVDPDRLFKTLVVDLTAGKGSKRVLGVCVLPVSHQLSLKKAAAAHGVPKVTMADPADAQKSSGYVPGGISPLGQKNVLPTVIDETAVLFETIFFSGGRRGLDVEMNAEDLAPLVNARFADVCAD